MASVHGLLFPGHPEEPCKAPYPGLTPLEILEKFATIRMVDFHQPTADGRHLILPRYTQLDGAHKLLLHQLGLKLPKQPPPRLRI